MGVLNAFAALVSAVIAAVVMIAFTILSVFFTVFIVEVAANITGLEPDAGFVVLGGTTIAAGAIISHGSGFALFKGTG